MPAVTVSPVALARTLSKSLGRPITDKAVRTLARDVLPRFDKAKHPAYQSHAYSAAEAKTLTAAFGARGQRSAAQPKRAAAKPRTRKAVAPAPVAQS